MNVLFLGDFFKPPESVGQSELIVRRPSSACRPIHPILIASKGAGVVTKGRLASQTIDAHGALQVAISPNPA